MWNALPVEYIKSSNMVLNNLILIAEALLVMGGNRRRSAVGTGAEKICALQECLSFDPYRTPLLGRAACREFLPTILRRCRRPSRPRPEQAVADRAQKAASTINRGHDPRRVECAVAIGG